MKKNIINISQYEKILTGTEKYIVMKINGSPEIIVGSGIQKAAKALHSSVSSLSRLSQKIGYQNYTDFRIYMAQEIMRISKYVDLNIANENFKDIKTVANFSINETICDKKINKKIIDFSNKISNNDYIFIYGIESSALGAKELNKNLTRIGLISQFTDVFDTMVLWTMLHKKKKIIIFSDSLKSKRINKLINLVDPQNLLIITGNKFFTKQSAVHYHSLKANFIHEEFGAKYSQLIIADMLFMQLTKRHDFENINQRAKLIINDI